MGYNINTKICASGIRPLISFQPFQPIAVQPFQPDYHSNRLPLQPITRLPFQPDYRSTTTLKLLPSIFRKYNPLVICFSKSMVLVPTLKTPFFKIYPVRFANSK